MFSVIATAEGHQFVVSEHADELEARIAALLAEAEIRGLIQTPYVITVESDNGT